MFCTSEYANSSEYRELWQSLRRGELQSGEFERINKSRNIIWLEASYNPTFDDNGKVIQVIKLASDITARAEQNNEQARLSHAISRSMAIIEFDMSGRIITANDNFLSTMGYRLEQIEGQYHRMFCDSELANSSEYQSMWSTLNRGQFVSGQFKRIEASGNTIWLEASYNPLFNIRGEPTKVVKFATDVRQELTLQVQLEKSLIQLR